MKTNLGFSLAGIAILSIQCAMAQSPSPKTSAPIPIDQLGAVAGKQYQGDGLSVVATPHGARLRCTFQRLEGMVTRDGLWLSSTADGSSGERFRVMAVIVGRNDPNRHREVWPSIDPFNVAQPTLAMTGTVDTAGEVVRFVRDGLIEEYSVNMDGVRQDFILHESPSGDGELRLELEVAGATAEPLSDGVRLSLEYSGRKLAYNRLRVVDASGQQLMARLEVNAPTRLVALVNDRNAVYPVRIDPTFSDEDWNGVGQPPGPNGSVFATAVDASGNLYIGGDFSEVGGVPANALAKWDGSSWSALGSGLEGNGGGTYVYALAVSGSNLFVGGIIGSAGGNPANGVARWDGSAWFSLGTGNSNGVDNEVQALAVSGTNLYAAGHFSTAGGIEANRIAKWDGDSWSALGSGLDRGANALVVAGTNLYVGGSFTTAGGNSALRIAKWDGITWSALGSGVTGGGSDGSWVSALAVSGNDLYAGGEFTIAGGTNANYVAKWNGISWSALGTGMDSSVRALAVSGEGLYAGGFFTMADGKNANYITEWDGNTWSPLGSGMNGFVYTLAMSGSDLYVGGGFTTAGSEDVSNLALAIGPAVFTSIAPNPSGTQAILTFTTAPGASLHLLDSTNLTTWQTNSTIQTTSVTNTVSVNLIQGPEFFRLQRLP